MSSESASNALPSGGNNKEIARIPCSVCGVSSSGYHFGAITCEGCKLFFCRSMKRIRTDGGEDKQGFQPFPETAKHQTYVHRCNESAQNAVTTCRRCRLEKCFQVGMSPTAICLGRHSAERRIQKNIAFNKLAQSNSLLQETEVSADSRNRQGRRGSSCTSNRYSSTSTSTSSSRPESSLHVSSSALFSSQPEISVFLRPGEETGSVCVQQKFETSDAGKQFLSEPMLNTNAYNLLLAANKPPSNLVNNDSQASLISVGNQLNCPGASYHPPIQSSSSAPVANAEMLQVPMVTDYAQFATSLSQPDLTLLLSVMVCNRTNQFGQSLIQNVRQQSDVNSCRISTTSNDPQPQMNTFNNSDSLFDPHRRL